MKALIDALLKINSTLRKIAFLLEELTQKEDSK